jgi:hypothetical protein
MNGTAQPEFKPGLWFGLDEETYHAVPALSNSGIKNLRASPMLFWSRSWMNPKPAKRETEFMELGKAYDLRITAGRSAFYAKYAAALDPEEYADALRTKEDLMAAIDALGGTYRKSARKDDLMAILLEINPEAEIWDDVAQEHRERCGDRILLGQDIINRIEVAARMIELDPQLCKAFTGGYPQVSIFWNCAETGIPMKARLDYLKVRAIVDLKTCGNPYDKPVDRAIAGAMATQKYHIQAVVYQEAIAAAKMLPVYGEPEPAWLDAFRKAPPPEFLFVFQLTGEAPVTRGFTFPAGLLTSEVGKVVVREAKEKFKACAEQFGSDPWLDLAPIRSFLDEEFPAFMTME